MRKLIILEGPDAIGKSTQAKLLRMKLNTTFIVQPSGDNILGFLRKIVKEDPSIQAFPRQLLHACSHIVDAFTSMSNSQTDMLMDRCHISSWVYGQVSGMAEKDLLLVHKIHEAVYSNVLSDLDVRIIFMDRRERYNNLLEDEFERTVNWSDIAIRYRELYKKAERRDLTFFNKEEKLFKIDVADFPEQTITEKLLEFVQ